MLITEVFPQGYKLVWSDEFNDTTLDLSKWSYDLGNGSNGWGNGEWEYYTNREQNCSERDSVLTITALKESFSGFNYTSARIKTQNKFSFRYGKIEARIKLPYGRGMWPAFWLLGENIVSVGWPACGENDIMEMVGGSGKNGNTQLSDATVYGTAHWSNNGVHAQYGNSFSLPSGKFADGYHIFSVVWDKTKIVWYVDGTAYNTIDITPAALSAFQNKFFIILNLAVGGSWPGYPDNSTVFPQTMKIDYVRVYQDTTAFPSVSIISPQDNADFTSGSDITLTANAATSNGTINKVEFYQEGEKIGESFISPYSMTWNNVQSGNYKVTCVAYTSTGLTSLSDTLNINVGSGAPTSPYGGTPAQIPGTIEAENYDLGGQGNAYNDSDPTNNGGLYRPADGVDIEGCTDFGGGYDIGWTQSGEWLLYTVNVADSGTYQIGARVSSASGGGSLHFEIDGTDVTGTMSVPNTVGWQTWTTVQSKDINLTTGLHKLKMFVNSAGFNLNKIEIYSPGAQPSINMLFPNGGEVFTPDSIVSIKWKSIKVDQVIIGFSTNGGTTWSLVQSGVDSKFGVYRWKVPAVSSSNCSIKVVDKDDLSILDTTGSSFAIGTVNSVKQNSSSPEGFILEQNYPNPFNPSTVISYRLPVSSSVTLKIYDFLGNEVATLVNGVQPAGNHSIVFDSSETFNHGHLSSGVYYYRLQAGSFNSVKKLVLLK